jgi:glyoxylase-like metal-dependent hydrolase (beta-lactamase superfamily II)
VQFAPSAQPPAGCPICSDERQYIGPDGQRWTTLDELAAEGHRTVCREQEPGLLGIGVEPRFGIGQRALLVSTPAGGLLWDPPGYLDPTAIEAVRDRGGLVAVSASHPHFYGVMVQWSLAFGGVPIFVPEADRDWVMRPDPSIRLWSRRQEVVPGVTLLQAGGHFAGSTVVHWADGAAGAGVLLTGDSVTVVADRRWVTFMRSYPNAIPLPERDVRTIVGRLAPYEFDRVYGGWWDSIVDADGKAAIERSADRYVRWLTGQVPVD